MTRDSRIDNLNWLIDLPTQTVPPSKIVWHYTDLAGLLGVLSTDTLWASGSGLLNDVEEFKHGAKVVRDAFELAKATMTPAQRDFVERKLLVAEESYLAEPSFVLCASTDGDSLSQWRGYSRGSGYAIGLRTSDRLDLLEIEGAREAENSEWQFVSPWRKVLYQAPQKASLAAEFISRLADLGNSPPSERWNEALVTAYAAPAYGAAISRMKHPGFKDEREVRLVAGAAAAERFYHFRAGAYGPTPYVKLTGSPTPLSVSGYVDYAQSQVEKLPIEEIRIGPTPHADAAEEGLRSALTRYGYKHVRVERSDLPFR